MRRLRRAQQRHAKEQKKFRRRVLTTGAAAAIAFGAGISLNKALAQYKPDNHQLPVSQDADSDLLSNKEEFAIGYQSCTADQNRSQIPDGVELAQRCADVINELPVYIPGTLMPIPNRTYKIQRALFGIERCDICGQEVNMGGWEIINPKINMQFPDPNDPLDGAFLPDLALHYMEHGSFDCYGDTHSGRVDIARLLRVLELRFPYEPDEHQLSIEGSDFDKDFLTNSEELAAGYNLHEADQDGNLVPDGIELATQCAEVIEALPVFDPNGPEVNAIYKMDFMQRGLEWCEVCGESVNMGYCRIVNLKLGLSIEVPYIVSHYMRHGSFSYSGDVHGKGRLDVPLLAKILEMPSRCGDLGTVYLSADLNKDCKVDIEDFVEFVQRWLEEQSPGETGG
jgi:Ca2+-binding EF-hand superfamily protein